MTVQCIYRGGCMHKDGCVDYCRAKEAPAALTSNERVSDERLAQLLLLEREILTQYVDDKHAPDERDRISLFMELQKRRAAETPAPQSEANADLSELKRLAAHYGGYAEKIMRAAANEIEQRRVEVEKYKAWAASCDPTPPDAKPDAWMSSINPDLVTSDENEVLCWNNPPIPLYRRAEKAPAPRRELSASERLHNICDALSEQADDSPFTREEWVRIDKRTVAVQGAARALLDKMESVRSLPYHAPAWEAEANALRTLVGRVTQLPEKTSTGPTDGEPV